MSTYPDDFYARRNERTLHAARTILPHVLDAVPGVDSAIDVGCGVGTWLAVLRERGIEDVQGVDGAWVDPQRLVIPRERFRSAELGQPLRLGRRYGLAISLEVAEHVPETSADVFVENLASLADFVLFSAAIPGQGGKGHVNEQWPGYWAARFAARGYVPVDLVRRRTWDDEDIPYWYRQNVLLYVKRERAGELRGLAVEALDTARGAWTLSVVHPRGYLRKVEKLESLSGSWAALKRALWRRLSNR